ncbi:hypothetical protein BCT11_07285 [Vibrio sp. 10N.222.52.B12]|uniref:NAD(P)/FAD-dependent oxidoreductase n=1 Tax=Vibrio sp. 10N.222.52.B12 TaxID=1880840 RepID=UPI000CB5B848|nr:FAD-dependent oxidoreductase [Vibrio sp. 10N.222.52.B12]PMO44901.1 hypothetical protein BCT11_07285 [Vibrio sp. 10N.222.52.B12]
MVNENTISLYKEITKELGIEKIIKQSGYITLYDKLSDFNNNQLGWKIRNKRGVNFERINSSQLSEQLPELSKNIECGVIINNDGYCSNLPLLCESLFELFKVNGGLFISSKASLIDNNGSISVSTNHGELNPEAVIITSGYKSKDILKKIGISVPIIGERGYHLHFKNCNIKPKFNIIHNESKTCITPMDSGLRVAGIAEFKGSNSSPDFKMSYEYLHSTITKIFPNIKYSEVLEWSGFRPSTPDSLPIISSLNKKNSLYINSGHGHTGLAGAPMSAKILADIVSDEMKHEYKPFSIERFQ